MGADAPAALAGDDRRAFRETEPLPIVAKSGASRFWGYAPLNYKSADGL